MKPPEPPVEGVTPHAAKQSQASNNPGPHATREGQAMRKRKARLVVCGNHAPSTSSELYASGAAAETLRCFVVLCSKRCWWLGSLDVSSAFLLTPIPIRQRLSIACSHATKTAGETRPRQGGELWILTHAVYGLRESPKLWSGFRDCQLLGLRCTVDGEELRLVRGRLDPNWCVSSVLSSGST